MPSRSWRAQDQHASSGKHIGNLRTQSEHNLDRPDIEIVRFGELAGDGKLMKDYSNAEIALLFAMFCFYFPIQQLIQ